MPGITEEWKLKLTENKLKYFIRIFSFDRKMKSWRNGRSVHSVPFLVGGTEFAILIYPNGSDEESRGHVSVNLMNKSDWGVKLEMEVEFGKEKVSGTFDMSSKEEWGWPMYAHADLGADDDAMNADGLLALSATVSLMWREVTESRSNSEIQLKECKCKAEVEGLRSEVGNLKMMIEAREANLVSKLSRSIGQSVDKSLTAKFKTLEVSSKKTSLPCPECPICFEEMKPPTRIIQCRSGHLVCQKCKERPQVVICPTCKQEFTGRAIGMENYLRTILG
eukprot:GFUD01027126.1.p1 GENE.GFUD01027126.1~~GFUD01027126.1.p1  ORF type:complete len:278 (-),score=48.35 GFUD01027126.1:72-905(-)